MASQLLEEVAAKEGTSPIALNPPLQTVIDTDALNTLFSGPKTPQAVQFQYHGYEIKVHGDGEIDIMERE